MFKGSLNANSAKNAIDQISAVNIRRGELTVCRIGVLIGDRVINVTIQKGHAAQLCAFTIVDRRLIMDWDFQASAAFQKVVERVLARLVVN
jgi:hypothetical protein